MALTGTHMPDRHLVYLAHGRACYLDEATYSLASFVAASGPGAAHITVYTDSVDRLRRRLPRWVSYERLDGATIRSWRGGGDFVHRVKVEALRDFCAKHRGAFVYVDTDTVFRRPLDAVFASLEGGGTAFLHLNEGPLASRRNPIFRKLLGFFGRNRFRYRGGTLQIPAQSEMWNAGFVGLHTDRRELLDEVLDLTDQFYARYRKHVMEQFAFSYVLTSNLAVQPAAEYVHHYWDFREFHRVLGPFLSKYVSFDEVMANLGRIDPERLIQPKLRYERQPLLARLVQKHLLRRTWSLPEVDL